MTELEPIDYKLLQFIAKEGAVSASVLAMRFPKVKSLEHRLVRLSVQSYKNNHPHLPIHNSSYILRNIESGSYVITDLGIKTLEDYRYRDSINRWRTTAEWIRYLITTAIAVIALVIALAALIMESGLEELLTLLLYLLA